MTLYTTILGVFVVIQLAVGLWIGRRMRGANDFFVAGRSLPAPLIFGTFLAANIGAGSTIGAASLGYSVGLGGWWWNASAGLGSLVFAFWAGPRLWALAQENGFLTLGDFNGDRSARSRACSSGSSHSRFWPASCSAHHRSCKWLRGCLGG